MAFLSPLSYQKASRRFWPILGLAASVSLGAVQPTWAQLAPNEAVAPATPPTPMTPEIERDFSTIKDRLRSLLLGSAPNLTPPTLPTPNLPQDDGSWAGIDYADQTRSGWKTSEHLSRVRTLALLFATPGQKYYAAPEIKAAILKALDFWLLHDYKNPNWWHNEIGVPQKLADILLLLPNDIPEETKAKTLALIARSHLKNTTGANLVWMARNQIVRGLFSSSPDLVAEAFNAMWNEIHLAPVNAPRNASEGIQSDFSFHQHGPVLYNGGYGGSFSSDSATFLYAAHGTRFDAPADKIALFRQFLLDGQQWMLRNQRWDYGVTGRELTRAGISAKGIQLPVALMTGLGGTRQNEMATFLARLQNPTTAQPLVGNRQFWHSDFMMQQRPGYMTSARMYSTRTLNTDGYINSENKQSHFLADGANYLMRRGDEYLDIFPVWDWRRVPGITAEQSTVKLEPTKVQSGGKTDFVGGVSDGTYGAATMDLQRDALSATKSWFFFDDEYLCLGTGITDTTANPVLTSVNQCLLNGGVSSSQHTEVAPGESDLPANAWVNHDNVGYIFPGGQKVHLKIGAQTGSWADIGAGSPQQLSKDVFSLWINHEAQPQNASYAYLVLPGSDATQTANRAAHPDVEILSNTPTLQAVRHNGLKILDALFRRAGTVEGGANWQISVDAPCLLLARETTGQLAVTLSNPRNAALQVHVEISRKLTGEGAQTQPGGTTSLTFDLPAGADAGRSVTRTFQLGG